jgi:hypothetical protein
LIPEERNVDVKNRKFGSGYEAGTETFVWLVELAIVLPLLLQALSPMG